jgi:2-dehydropantoate 2-reductase
MDRVLVAGAGAVGSVFGGLLANAGFEVTLLGRTLHMQAVARRGLRICGIWGEHRATRLDVATAPASWKSAFDAVLVTVKSYDTGTLAPLVAEWLAPRGVAISLQNGLGNLERLAAHVDPAHVFGGRVIFGAEVTEPGVVEVTVCAEPVRVGAWLATDDNAVSQAHRWAAAFRQAGIPAEPCNSIVAELWAKVFYNAALNPLGALLRWPYGALAANPETRALMDQVIAECFAVAQAERVPLPWSSAESYREHFYSRLVPPTAAHRSSMLQDLERGKRTEIDAINGEVWRRGALHGISTPLNELLTRLVRAATTPSQS